MSPFLFLICLDGTKFVFLSIFSLIETICPKIWSKSRPKIAKFHFRLMCVDQKRLCYNSLVTWLQPCSQGSVLLVPKMRKSGAPQSQVEKKTGIDIDVITVHYIERGKIIKDCCSCIYLVVINLV